ncbi:MAG: hypothetical protein IH793_00835 [Acidobacteria bacterium]|nr:hypothetical protein [Acidobacteriota bacterium]
MPPRKKTEDILKEILERLDLVVNLLGFQITSDKSMTDGARQLKMAGLDNRTIAEILNTTDAAVRIYTSNLRRKFGRKRG